MKEASKNSIQLGVDLFVERFSAFAKTFEGKDTILAKVVHSCNECLSALPIELLYLGAMFLAASILIGLFVAPIAGFTTYVERRVAGRIQSRVGCNRVGPEGLLQFLADGVKLILKEDFTPKGADVPLFKIAPYFVILGSFLSFVTIPFGAHLIVADLNVGLFYIMAVSSLGVIGILMAGWSSNNKWSLLGAMRSAAQIVSYEIPLGLSLMVPVLIVGSLSLQEMNMAQSSGVFSWNFFNPKFILATAPAAIIFFISGLAELNRTPFDLPEAESELVSGYNTEYSGIRWGLFFVAEYANIFLISAILVTAFFGGWQSSWANLPFGFAAMFFTLFLGSKSLIYFARVVMGLIQGKELFKLLGTIRPIRYRNPVRFLLAGIALIAAIAMQTVADHFLVTFLFFVAKVYFFVFVVIWIRWTLPRIRVDQMMDLCWKKLVPISFFCIFFTALAMLM